MSQDLLEAFTPGQRKEITSFKLVHETASRLLRRIKSDYKKAKENGKPSYILLYGYPRPSLFYVDAEFTRGAME